MISQCWFSGIFFNIANIGSSLFCFLNYESTITHLQETWKIQTKLHIVPLCIMLSHFSRVQLSVTPWTIARQAPLSMGFSRQEHWSGLPYPPPGYIPNPGVKPVSLMSPALTDGFFTMSTTWETQEAHSSTIYYNYFLSR